MRTDKIKKNLIILATLILFVCPPAHAGHFFSVPRVVDGDTIIVNIFGKKESVRLIGVDTPRQSTRESQLNATEKRPLLSQKSFAKVSGSG